jgi:hypothetical protein
MDRAKMLCPFLTFDYEINFMNRTLLWLFCLLMLGLSSPQIVTAQVSLAPTALFISDQTNVASLYINNNSQEAQEISISFEFAYPGSDEQGNMVTISNDSLSAAHYGITANLRVFPRQFVLQPGGQQTVRFQVRPMRDKPDGVYWSRVIVTSQKASKDIDTVMVTETIGTKISYVFKQNIPAFYVKGKVTTGLMPGKVITQLQNGKLVAIAELTPTGNAPFNGSVTALLLDSEGKEIAIQQQTVVAYFAVLRRIELSLPGEGLAPGKYTLEFTYETKRADISASDLVQAKPVRQSVAVEIK